MGAIRRHHQNYPDLDAAAYIIGIVMKNWVRECIISVYGGCMGSIMPWFAFGFVMSDALFSRFFEFLCVIIGRGLEFRYRKSKMHSKLIELKVIGL